MKDEGIRVGRIFAFLGLFNFNQGLTPFFLWDCFLKEVPKRVFNLKGKEGGI